MRTLRTYPAFSPDTILKAKRISPELGAISFKKIEPNRDVPEHYEAIKKENFNQFTDATPVLALRHTRFRRLWIASAVSAQTKKPNILVIFGDDIGIPQISAYSMGMMVYHTPNIDRIANDLGLTDNTIVVYTTDNGAEIALWPDGAIFVI